MSRILVLCAHPDDESFGLGGTLALHAKNKSKVNVLFFTDGEKARGNSSKIQMRKNQAKRASSILGIKILDFLDYDDQKLDTISTLDLIQHIEKVINEKRPEIIYTHFWADLNQDHRKVFDASLIAARPLPKSSVKQLICYETPSSTEWGIESFNPNLFVNIESTITKKIQSCQKYSKEIKSFPHPRSKQSIINRSKYWGSVVGLKYAEAFYQVRQII